jgi:hypothetical protein
MRESLSEISSSGEAWRACLPSLPILPNGSRTKIRYLIHALEQLAVSERCRLTNDSDRANERVPGKI